jgi:hypothetical protein
VCETEWRGIRRGTFTFYNGSQLFFKIENEKRRRMRGSGGIAPLFLTSAIDGGE